MYNKVKKTESNQHSESDSSSSVNNTRTQEDTDEEYDLIRVLHSNSDHENSSKSSNIKIVDENREQKVAKSTAYEKTKKIKAKYGRSSYTYDTIIGLHLYNTSDLKFKSYIRSPRVKVSIFDIKRRSYLLKSNSSRNVILNFEPHNVDYVLPIISKAGALSKAGRFSFTFNETLIINEDIRHIIDDNVVLIFEIIDMKNSKTWKKSKKSDGWQYICWAFFKPHTDEQSHINKQRTLQLYKYKKPHTGASAFQQWLDVKRAKYPATISVVVQEVKFHQEEVKLTRPHTALQQDKDDNDYKIESFLNGANTVHERSAGNCPKDNVATIMSLIKFKRSRSKKFECPSRELRSVHLPKKCLMCRFSSDGQFIAYTECDKVSSDIIIAESVSLKPLRALKGHSGIIHCIQWKPNQTTEKLEQQILLSASEDRTCIIWYLSDKSYSMEVLPHTTFVYSAEFIQVSENFFTIASGCRNAMLYIWKINKTRNIHLEQEISKHDFYIVGISYGAEVCKMFTGDVGGYVFEWIKDKNNSVWNSSRTFCISESVHNLQLIEKINTLFVSSNESLHKIDLKFGLQRKIFSQTELPKGFNYAVTNCGTIVIFTSNSNELTCWNLQSDTLIETITICKTRNCFLRSIDFFQDKNFLVLSLSSKLSGNYLLLYGSFASNDIKMCERNDKQTEKSPPIKDMGLSYDYTDNSRLGSIFNEVLDKCDSIIRYGSTSEDKLATDRNAIVVEGIDNENSIKSDKTFIVSNKSAEFGNTFSVEVAKKNTDDDTDASEILDSSN